MMAQHSIVVLGDAGVGKTSLILQAVMAYFPREYDGTIEDSYTMTLAINAKELQINILDTGGNPELEAFRSQWCRSGDAFIIVFSANSRDSFNDVKHFADEVIRKHPTGHPLALVATKADLPRAVSWEEGQRLSDALQAAYFDISATQTTEALKPFVYLAHALTRLHSPLTPDHTIIVNPRTNRKVGQRLWKWYKRTSTRAQAA